LQDYAVKNSPGAEKARDVWRKSRCFREIASEGAKKALRLFADAPKCAARTRDGGACQNPGLGAGGRCRLHGGATPRGDQWHVRQFPADARGFQNKLVTFQIRDREREARLAAMTPAERETFEKRARSLRPGSKAKRAAEREERRRNAEARELLSRARRAPPGPGVVALESQIAELEAQLSELGHREHERRLWERIFG
jgi:hypothetical protein